MDYERLGAFYLGRRQDEQTGQRTDEPILYDARDLTTHAVIVGMTGSGKTGLGIGLIEEAAIDRIPVIAVDPKGDLANLMLTFPELRPADFEPWVGADEVAASGKSAGEVAAAKAKLWREGLASWDQDGERIRRLREAADFAVYTPGSTAGLPLSVLQGFDAPPAAIRDDAELYAERIAATATSLLALLQIEADPLTSREHILLSNLLSHAWNSGRTLDLAGLIAGVQQPPFEKIGVLALDAVFPPKDRLAFALRINNLLASPGFQAWTTGEPLRADRLLYTETGKPRVSVLSIAHLSDAERMFFLCLLLAELTGWMRAQPGTGSLRAILYIDELFGYMPPVANPPSKTLLLTLLKQARAFGVGLVLATQNPVDLDYKGLSNAGTWFVGRLQTERDKLRLVEGLLGAAGGSLDRAAIERLISGLGKRVFLLHNVHEDAPVLFETRWVMSYLAGPMTRDQIRTLMDGRAVAEAEPAVKASGAPAGLLGHAPAAPAGVPQYFLPVQRSTAGEPPVYLPRVIGLADITYDNARHSVHEQRRVMLIAPVTSDAVSVQWSESQTVPLEPAELEAEPLPDAHFEEPAAATADPKCYATWTKALQTHLRTSAPLVLLRSATLKLVSAGGESERDFRIRLQGAAREQRDAAMEKLRAKYAPKLATLDDRIRRAEQAVERERAQARQSGLNTAVNVGGALLGALMGNRKMSRTTMSRMGTAVRSAGRATRDAGDIGRAEENVGALVANRADLESEMQAALRDIEMSFDAQAESLEELEIRPKASDVHLHAVGLAWAPHVRSADGSLRPLWRS
jgi:hypothetical protein